MGMAAKLLAGLSVLLLVASCGPNYEREADIAYSLAKRTSGFQQRENLKKAFVGYQKTIKARGVDRISTKVRERFAEMCLTRANMVLNEGNARADAIPLFIEDLDKIWAPTLPTATKRTYATFLVQLADSLMKHGSIYDAIAKVDHAMQVADDPSPFQQKRLSIVSDFAKQNLSVAKVDYEQGLKDLKDKEADAMVMAEYNVKVCLMFDSTNAEALELLSKIRKSITGYYSAYRKVIDPIPDTVIFRKIDKYGILLSLPAFLQGGAITAKINFYNFSNNPQRLKPEYFFVVDEDGNKFPGRGKIEKDLLDQEHETTFSLTFPKPAKPVKKLIFEANGYYSEKYLF